MTVSIRTLYIFGLVRFFTFAVSKCPNIHCT